MPVVLVPIPTPISVPLPRVPLTAVALVAACSLGAVALGPFCVPTSFHMTGTSSFAKLGQLPDPNPTASA
eukprot:5932370-Amphidinium_carterae.1